VFFSYSNNIHFSQLIFPLINQYCFTYSTNSLIASFRYENTGSTVGIENVISGYYSIAATDQPLTALQLAENPHLQLLPVIGGPILLAFHFGTGDAVHCTSLNLTREDILGIFTDGIQYWNDTRLTPQTDPACVLPSTRITKVLNHDSPSTEVLAEGLTSFAEDCSFYPWEYESGLQWTTAVADTEAYYVYNGSLQAAVFAMDFLKMDGISIAGPGDVHLMETQNSHLINILGDDDEILDPARSTYLAMHDAEYDSQLVTSYVDVFNGATYPFISITYFVMPVESSSNCEDISYVIYFLYWLLNDVSQRQRAIDLGFLLIPHDTYEQLVEPKLFEAQCNGAQAFDVIFVENSVTFFEGLVVSIFCLILTGGILFNLVWRLFRRRRKTIKWAREVFNLISLSGCMINFIAAITFFLYPSFSVCNARLWLTCIGCCLILTGMIVNIYQIRRTVLLITLQLSSKPRPLLALLKPVGLILLGQCFHLFLWMLISPLEVPQFDADHLHQLQDRKCEAGPYHQGFLAFEVICIMAALCLGTVYSGTLAKLQVSLPSLGFGKLTGDLKTATAVACMALFMVLPSMFGDVERSRDIEYLFAVNAIVAPTIVIVFLRHVPLTKFARFIMGTNGDLVKSSHFTMTGSIHSTHGSSKRSGHVSKSNTAISQALKNSNKKGRRIVVTGGGFASSNVSANPSRNTSVVRKVVHSRVSMEAMEAKSEVNPPPASSIRPSSKLYRVASNTHSRQTSGEANEHGSLMYAEISKASTSRTDVNSLNQVAA
jgi:ABC-type phosphate transport system substrate-binding protein